MDAWQTTINASSVTLGFVALAGLVVRGRLRRAAFFASFLGLVSTYGLIVALYPGVIAWRLWVVKEVTLGVVALLAALEIGLRMFAKRGGARPRAGLAALIVMAFTAFALGLDLSAPAAGSFATTAATEILFFELAREVLPRLAYGAAWLFTVVWAVARRCAVPLDAWHEAVLLGSSIFWVLQATCLGLLVHPTSARLASDFVTVSFLVVVSVWAAMAWRRESPPAVPPEIVRELWPWS